MKRYLASRVLADLDKKIVMLTGARQVGKTTLNRDLISQTTGGIYLNYVIPRDRAIMLAQEWSARTPLLVFDELHKMPNWKAWLKGVFDGRSPDQHILVTGSARMETFRQAGDSLAGRYYALRLHPISVREWCAHSQATPDTAMLHLLKRGGFPEPCLAADDASADRWRSSYYADMMREDIVEFSRVQELNAMRLFADTLRQRVGSPLSLASIARDMAVSPKTLTKYLDILEALFIVFTVRPWGHNIARATLQQPKVYFYDTGLVQGDEGIHFENLVACHLLKHAQWLTDTTGKSVGLHYIRTKDDAEVDFALSDASAAQPTLTHLIECKIADTALHRALKRFADMHPQVASVQLVRDARYAQEKSGVAIEPAGEWLAGLAA